MSCWAPIAPTQVIVDDAAKALIGHTLDDADAGGDRRRRASACKPITDKRGTIAYRIKVAGVLTRRAAAIAFARARGETPATTH